MGRRRFTVRFQSEIDIEIDDAVIQAVDADWRSSLYNLHTPEEIAQHIGFNLVINGLHLSSMDGWANLDNDMASIVGPVDWSVEATEQVK